ncbi:hypothetical protein RJT34_03506 [Clitoria ternatea]|uniref:Protein kinase domain-containing protein n=1 Tax=Clitoria ternatea TaxID=43366 RepID=A0AAN9Q2L0_CLITE
MKKTELGLNQARGRSYVVHSGIKDNSIPLGRTSFIPPPSCSQCGFGVVHKGLLKDGQVIVVKQLKFGGSQEVDLDFYREVWVLSCAQHKNVVLLTSNVN